MIEVHGNEIELTKKGTQSLEPYKVKRAVIMAASFDANLIPITVNTPKSMMKINGKRIIERTFEILAKAEIEEIFVITGYSSDVSILLNLSIQMLHLSALKDTARPAPLQQLCL